MAYANNHVDLTTLTIKTAENLNEERKVMNTLQVKGNWNVAKGKLKQKYAQLTDDDLQYVEGKEDELIGRIQKRTGAAKEAVEQTVDECLARKKQTR
jgi:uncharacterized protein YjbJ (UPF0337 family)